MIYEDKDIKLVWEESEIPWIKLFSQKPYKEMSDAPKILRYKIYETINTIETLMLEYFQPEKINIASFGNYLPHLHWHIMARYKNDSYFPEPMWGEKQRESKLELPSFELFEDILKDNLIF